MSRDIKAFKRLVGAGAITLVTILGAAQAQAAGAAPLLLAQSSQGGLSVVEQELQQAVEARRAKDFDRAREILAGLERQVGSDSPMYWQVRDEQRFHLPLAMAQRAMNQGEVGLAESKIDEAASYLSDHPRRGELSQTLERYRRALWMAK